MHTSNKKAFKKQLTYGQDRYKFVIQPFQVTHEKAGTHNDNIFVNPSRYQKLQLYKIHKKLEESDIIEYEKKKIVVLTEFVQMKIDFAAQIFDHNAVGAIFDISSGSFPVVDWKNFFNSK